MTIKKKTVKKNPTKKKPVKKKAGKKKNAKKKPANDKLTLKQEAAAQAFIENKGNKSDAYRTAYETENMSDEAIWVEACKLFKRPKVALRVVELQSEHRERHNVTVDSITTELDEAKDLAKTEKQPAAMTGAIMGKAKIHGLVTDNKKLTGAIGVVDLSNKSDEELKAIINGTS